MTLTPLRDDRLLAPLREHLAELGPLAEAAVVEWLLGLQEPPGWARSVVFGPWQRMPDRVESWGRLGFARHGDWQIWGLRVWRAQGGWWRTNAIGGADRGPFSSRTVAMETADGESLGQGYLHDNVRPPEEAPPSPTPAPAPEVGPGRRVGQHRWTRSAAVDGQRMYRCKDCGLWKMGRQHASASYPAAHARSLLEMRAGETRAGRCPGRRP